MAGSNERTIATYDRHVPEYVARTSDIVSGAFQAWIDSALHDLPCDAAILELGSGHGRDALYIGTRGYAVSCTDATPAFVDHLRGLGLDAGHFNALTDSLAEDHDLIFANAVLLHFARDDFSAVLGRMAKALRPGGRFAFSLKQGDGETWSEAKLNAPRYFCYWQPDALPALLSKAGFSQWTIDAIAMEREHSDWIFVIARR